MMSVIDGEYTKFILGRFKTMKTAIAYKSFLGTTRQYAMWLHESVESDVFKANDTNLSRMAEYDLIVLCSGTYMGWIRMASYLKRNWEVLRNKKVILLVTGIAPPEDPESRKAFEKIPGYIRKDIEYFKLPGKIGRRNQEQVDKRNLVPVLEYIGSLTGQYALAG
jgi:hypothetical protein